jgi:hypothetical protein
LAAVWAKWLWMWRNLASSLSHMGSHDCPCLVNWRSLPSGVSWFG